MYEMIRCRFKRAVSTEWRDSRAKVERTDFSLGKPRLSGQRPARASVIRFAKRCFYYQSSKVVQFTAYTAKRSATTLKHHQKQGQRHQSAS